MYEKIIWHCQQNGLQSKVSYYSDILAEIEDKENRLSITNFANNLWWSRGQNKTKAVLITFCFFMVFFLLNWKFFEDLKCVYFPKAFKEYFNRIERIEKALMQHPGITKYKWSIARGNRARVAGIFFYSGLIFWNIKMDFDNLRMNNLYLCFFILFQHLVGLLFIANIIGFIIIGS